MLLDSLPSSAGSDYGGGLDGVPGGGPRAPLPPEDLLPQGAQLRPSFSRQCKRIIREQREPTTFDVERLYTKCTIFQRCSHDFVRCLIDLGGPFGLQGQIFDPGEYVVREGELSSSMYLIHRGEAEVLASAVLRPVSLLGEGQHFGEMQLLGLTQ